MTIGMLGILVAVSALVSICLTPLVRRAALKLGIMDQPGPRKIHRSPIPRAGGVAVYIAWLVAVMIMGMECLGIPVVFSHPGPLIGLGLLALLLGLWDDWKDLPGAVKLLGQIGVASAVFLAGIRIDRLTHPLGGELLFPGWLSYLVTVLWIVGMMNAVNLIDGLDGLAAGVVAIASLGLVAAGLHTQNALSVIFFAALAGACGGFLVHNFFPAKIFLGDAGSQFLGVILAAAPLMDFPYKSATAVALLIPLTSLALPIYDTWLALFRRFRGRRSVFRADKYHLHHRLLKMGLSHRQVVLFLYLVSGYLSCVAFMFVLIDERYAIMLLVLLALGLLMAMRTLRFVEFRLRTRYRRRFAKSHAAG